jgi:hypothetical protein
MAKLSRAKRKEVNAKNRTEKENKKVEALNAMKLLSNELAMRALYCEEKSPIPRNVKILLLGRYNSFNLPSHLRFTRLRCA